MANPESLSPPLPWFPSSRRVVTVSPRKYAIVRSTTPRFVDPALLSPTADYNLDTRLTGKASLARSVIGAAQALLRERPCAFSSLRGAEGGFSFTQRSLALTNISSNFPNPLGRFSDALLGDI